MMTSFDNILSEHNVTNEIRDSDATQNPTNYKSRKIPKAAIISSFKTNRDTSYPLPGSKPAELSNSSSQNNIHTLTSRIYRVAPSELYSLREHFQSISQKQADAEFIHAESAKIQAEASRTNALAMTEITHAIQKLADTAAVQAVNDSERIRIFEKLTAILENWSPTYLNE